MFSSDVGILQFYGDLVVIALLFFWLVFWQQGLLHCFSVNLVWAESPCKGLGSVEPGFSGFCSLKVFVLWRLSVAFGRFSGK